MEPSSRRAKLSAHPSLCQLCLLALLVGHFSATAGTMLATEQLPMLLLALWGLFALQATLLSAALPGCSCLMQGESAQIYDLPRRQPGFASGRQWSHGTRAASPTTTFGIAE